MNLSAAFLLERGELRAVRPRAAVPGGKPERQPVSLTSEVQQASIVRPSVSRESVLGFPGLQGCAALIEPDSVQPVNRMHVPFAFLKSAMPVQTAPMPDSSLRVIGNFPRRQPLETPATIRRVNHLLQIRKRIPSWVPSTAAAVLLLLMLRFVFPPSHVAPALENKLASIRATIQQRAALVFADDFQPGMGAWVGSRNWARSWSFHQSGYTSPGRLALYRPSATLTDYRLDFLAQIDRKGVDWVTRATDLKNYYVTKLLVVKPGLRPVVSLVRYPVIDGKKGAVTERPIRMMLHNKTPYRVRMDVRGSEFSVMIEGTLIDSWSDEVQQAGAVGFFTDRGERSRLYWMKLAYQDDIVGTICARLTPVLAMAVNTNSRVRASN